MGVIRGLATAAIVAGLFRAFVTTALAADVRPVGPGIVWHDLTVVTNSVQSVADFRTDGSIVSTSVVDTCLAVIPDWSAWQQVPDGALDVWVDVVADGSNTVTVLLGHDETPALTLSCATDWAVLAGGDFPTNALYAASDGPCTNRIHLLLRTLAVRGGGQALVRTQAEDARWVGRNDLQLNDLQWIAPQQSPRAWSRVGICLSGPQAQLLVVRLRWRADGTLMLLR